MKNDPTTLCAILDALLTRPHSGLGSAAKNFGLAVSTAFRWQAESARDEKDGFAESPYNIEWLGLKAFWHRHVALARRLSIQQIDAKVREMAVSGTREPMVNAQTGRPMWLVSPELASDAMQGPAWWEFLHGDRPIEDIYERDEHGALIQMYKTIEPSAAMLLGAAKALIPEVYGETIKHQHDVNVGGVLRIAATPSAPQLSVPRTIEHPAAAIVDADYTMAIEDHTVDDAPQPSNVLAVAERPKSVQEFEETFGGKRLVEAVLFYDELGALMPPRSEITIVEGSKVHRLYAAAGIECATVSATSLVEKGYCNPFLLALANAEACAPASAQPSSVVPGQRVGAGKEDTPLVRELRARLREGVKHPRPTAPVNLGNHEAAGGDMPDDAPAPRPMRGEPRAPSLNQAGVGRGTVPPGGFRVSK